MTCCLRLATEIQVCYTMPSYQTNQRAIANLQVDAPLQLIDLPPEILSQIARMLLEDHRRDGKNLLHPIAIWNLLVNRQLSGIVIDTLCSMTHTLDYTAMHEIRPSPPAIGLDLLQHRLPRVISPGLRSRLQKLNIKVYLADTDRENASADVRTREIINLLRDLPARYLRLVQLVLVIMIKNGVKCEAYTCFELDFWQHRPTAETVRRGARFRDFLGAIIIKLQELKIQRVGVMLEAEVPVSQKQLKNSEAVMRMKGETPSDIVRQLVRPGFCGGMIWL